MKFPGIAGADAVNNIPVFRVSEMYLIMAEAAAQSGDVSGARKELLNTAKRNPAIRTEGDLPGTKEALLAFIAEERQRELFEEGHRWYDARRTGEKIEVADGKYKNFNVRSFVFPIPADEINAGFGTQQNPNWVNAMPK